MELRLLHQAIDIYNKHYVSNLPVPWIVKLFTERWANGSAVSFESNSVRSQQL